jgi:hypothetical protein
VYAKETAVKSDIKYQQKQDNIKKAELSHRAHIKKINKDWRWGVKKTKYRKAAQLEANTTETGDNKAQDTTANEQDNTPRRDLSDMSKLHPSTFKNIYAIEAKTRADLRKNEATKKAKQAQLQKKQYHQEVNREWKWGMKNPLRKTSESEAPTTQESAPVAQESTKVEDKSTDVKRD